MEALVIRYYNINRFLLSLTGLWPFQNEIVRKILNFFVHALLMSSILVQIFKLVTSEFSIELYFNVSTYAIICLSYTCKYVSFVWQLENIKSLIIRLCHNWDTVVDEREYEIMDKYALKGKRFTFVCLIISCTIVTLFMILPISLYCFNKTVSLNDSRYMEAPFLAEYFVNEEVYIYYILTHMYVIIFIGLMIVIAGETFFATCAIHACGLFYIAGYRFEKAFNETTIDFLPYTKKTFEMSEKITSAIEAHNNAIEFVKNFIKVTFVDHMNSCFSTCYFILLILAVATLTVNFAAIFEEIKADKFYNVYTDFSRIFNVMCYLFCASYCGQKLIDCSTGISGKVYDLPWFLAPPKIRGLLLMVMQRSLKRCTMILGSLFPVSFEFFTLVLKLTLYYATSLRTLQ